MYSVPLDQATVDLQPISPYRTLIKRQQRSQEAAMKYIMFEDFSGVVIVLQVSNSLASVAGLSLKFTFVEIWCPFPSMFPSSETFLYIGSLIILSSK